MTWTQGDADVGGVSIRWARTGEGPPLVLAHGFSDSGMCWRVAAADLARDHEVVVYDARGHGESSKPSDGYTIEDHAADLRGLIGALGLVRPAAIGHSMGGSTVADAARDDGLLRCAVLEDPPWRNATAPTPLDSRAGRDAGRRWMDEMRTRTLEQLIEAQRAQAPGWHADEFEPWARSKLQLSPDASKVMGSWRTPWQDTVRAIAVPALLVTADPSRGAIVTPDVAGEASKLQPLLEVVRVDDAGHNVRRENLAAYLSAVRGFLSAHP